MVTHSIGLDQDAKSVGADGGGSGGGNGIRFGRNGFGHGFGTLQVTAQKLGQVFEVAGIDHFGGSVGPGGGNREMRPIRRQGRHGQVAIRQEIRGVIASEDNFRGIGELFELGAEGSEGAIGFFHADEDATAGFAAGGVTHGGHIGNWAAGQQAANVDHFVGVRRGEDALQSAGAGTLLDDECDGDGALNF